MARAIGNQGNWFARIEAAEFPEIHGQNLPCVWDFWWTKNGRYRDEGYERDQPNFVGLVAGLRSEGKVILRRRKKNTEPNEWKADGYIAVYEIADISDDNYLEFRFTRRICDLD